MGRERREGENENESEGECGFQSWSHHRWSLARSVAMRERERRDFKHTLRSETTFSTIPFLFYGGGGGNGGGGGDMQMKTCDFGREREKERREALLG